MVWMSGPKNASARDSAAMRWPSRQITASEIAGASGRAAMARARSASTRPSAPSATCASVSGCAGLQQFGGRFQPSRSFGRRDGSRRSRRNSARVDLGRHGFRAVDPGENLLVGHVEPALVFVEFGLAQVRDSARRQSGRAPDPSRGCRDASERNSNRRRRASSPSLEICVRSSYAPTPKTRTGPGAGLYRGLRRRLSAPALHSPALRRETRKPAWRQCARRCSIRCLPPSPACPASGRSWRSSMRGCSTARRRASSTCCFICPPAPSTAARGRSSTRCRPARSSPSRSPSTSTGRRRRTARARPTASSPATTPAR